MTDIFISYKREEQAKARLLANALERQGWTVWWDPRLRAGERFDDVIEAALAEARCVIVMWSRLSVKSRYVKDEASYALKRNKLAPVAIEEVVLPFRFEGLHTPNMLDWDGSEEAPAFRSLVEDVTAILGYPPKQREQKNRDELLKRMSSEPAKPATPPSFPGASPHSVPERPAFPGASTSIGPPNPPTGWLRRVWNGLTGKRLVPIGAFIAGLFGIGWPIYIHFSELETSEEMKKLMERVVAAVERIEPSRPPRMIAERIVEKEKSLDDVTKMRETTKRVENLQKRYEQVPGEDPAVAMIKRQATQALEAGDLDRAEKWLNEARAPKGRAVNYRSEPLLHRLAINADPKNNDLQGFPFAQKKALAFSSYAFGDPATPIPRSYLGEPTKTRLVHGGSEVLHVHHLHGGGVRWRRNPKSDPNNDIASGLNKRPHQNVLSTHLDSQTIGPGTSYNLENECGAGGCQQAAGDFVYHGHIGHPYIGGMWGLWRVFDTWQADLAKLPDMPDPPKAVDSTQLVGKTFEGKMVVTEADPNDRHQISLSKWVESQLPPQGVPIDNEDATVWNWIVEDRNGLPLYKGEPETTEKWVNYPSPKPGERPRILFNPINGRYAWPLFRPHLGQRPPFAPNGHSGAPWLGERGSEKRPDGLCPDPKQWRISQQTIRHYPISAVPVDVPRMDIPNNEVGNIDRDGKIFVLNEDIRGETPDGKVLLSESKNIEPLVIRSNVGDCVRVIFTSKLPEDKKLGLKSICIPILSSLTRKRLME